MTNTAELNASELDIPFDGVEAVRQGPDLLRTRIWSFDRGLLRATKGTIGEFRVRLEPEGHLEKVDLKRELDDRPSYSIDFIFQAGEQLLAASSSWGVKLEKESALIQQLRRGVRQLGDVEITDFETPELAFELLDEVREEPGEPLFFRQGLIEPDVLSIDGMFTAMRSYQSSTDNSN